MARKILLADDSVTAQNMGRKILTDAGYEVMTVNNGSAALKRVAEQKPDLIVLDVYMPGYSGLEVCQRLKDARDTSRIPILLTVGKLEPFKPEDARRVSADAFIVKPFEASELLSALTRMEDRIVPQGDGSRFATSVSGIERFAADPAVRAQDPADAGEPGWKSRIRFPSKKKKTEEPEPEPDFATPPVFRDFRSTTAKTSADATPQPKAPSQRQEPGLVPDIPHDITPDELDALSALVAKLDGPIPKAEEIAPIGDNVGPSVMASEADAEVAAPSSSEAATAPAPTVDPLPRAEAAGPAPEATLATEDNTETGAVTVVEPAAPDYTSAPIDRGDEPLFASAASAVPQSSPEEKTATSEQFTTSTSEAIVSESAPPAEVSAPAPESKQPPVEEVEKEKAQARVEEMVAEAVAEQSVDEQPPVKEDRIPSDEELAEALKLLTPVHDPAPEQVQAAASLQQKESVPASRDSTKYEPDQAHSGNGSRWLAEAVELSPEEASISLESEMFRTVTPARILEPAVAAETASAAGTAADQSYAADVSEAPVLSQKPASEVIAATPAAIQAEMSEPAATEATQQEPLPEGMTEQPAQEPISATFAAQYAAEDKSDSQSSMPPNDEIVHEQVDGASAAVSDDEESTGDPQSMAKQAKTDRGKGSKSGWHQIHAAAPTSKTDVEEAKLSEAQPPTEDSPKALAAAAASDDTVSATAPDPSAIASIVDSVLADLRPRIVEEIAKKLAKK